MKHTLSSYLEDLEARLPLLTAPQRAEIIAEYQTQMTAEIAAGTPEREVLRKFGKPAKVAHQFYTTYGVYERFRKWQYLALVFIVIVAVGLNEHAFGNPEAVYRGRLPSVWLWNIGYFLVGPAAYWWMTARCRSQRILPILATYLTLTVGLSATNIKMANAFDLIGNPYLSKMPSNSSVALQLSKVVDPVNQILLDSVQTVSTSQFAQALSHFQVQVLTQRDFLKMRTGERGTYLIPREIPVLVGAPTPIHFVGLEFGFTNDPASAKEAWKKNRFHIESFTSQLSAENVEYSVGLKRYTLSYALSQARTWVLSGLYLAYVVGVGILLSLVRIPSVRSRRGIA